MPSTLVILVFDCHGYVSNWASDTIQKGGFGLFLFHISARTVSGGQTVSYVSYTLTISILLENEWESDAGEYFRTDLHIHLLFP